MMKFAYRGPRLSYSMERIRRAVPPEINDGMTPGFTPMVTIGGTAFSDTSFSKTAGSHSRMPSV